MDQELKKRLLNAPVEIPYGTLYVTAMNNDCLLVTSRIRSRSDGYREKLERSIVVDGQAYSVDVYFANRAERGWMAESFGSRHGIDIPYNGRFRKARRQASNQVLSAATAAVNEWAVAHARDIEALFLSRDLNYVEGVIDDLAQNRDRLDEKDLSLKQERDAIKERLSALDESGPAQVADVPAMPAHQL